MLNLAPRAHLPTVQFSPRAYMGCGGWDLAQAPQMTTPSLDEDEGPIVTLKPGLSGARRPQVVMGCGDEECETCSEMGCTKCKRIRKHAMMNQELEGSRHLGQAPGLPDTSILVVSGLAVAGLFYLATR